MTRHFLPPCTKDGFPDSEPRRAVAFVGGRLAGGTRSATGAEPVGFQFRACYDSRPANAVTVISTWAPAGKLLTSTVVRPGGLALKYSA